jgi:hypothetical protein
MPKAIINIIRGGCLFLVLHLFIISAHTEGIDTNSFDLEYGEVSVSQQPNHNYQSINEATHKRQESIATDQHHSKKSGHSKQIITHLAIIPKQVATIYTSIKTIVQTPTVPKTYKFLFYQEINPPPPKSC